MTSPLPDDLVTGNPIDADEDWNPLVRAVNAHQQRLSDVDARQEQAGAVTTQVTAATTGLITITYPTPYPVVPVITYSLADPSALALLHKISATTPASFTVRVTERTGAAFTATLTVRWIARLP